MSTDSRETNAAFARKYQLPFPLLSDTDREICTAYGACVGPDDAQADRITYVIDPDGVIAQVHRNVDPNEHAETLLASIDGVTSAVHRDVTSAALNRSGASMYEDRPTEEGEKMADERTGVGDTRSQGSTHDEPDTPGQPLPANELQSPDSAIPTGTGALSPSSAPAADEMTSVNSEALGQVSASANGESPVSLVFALGTFGCDFGTEARRDSITQHMGEGASPYDPEQLLTYLEENPWDAAAITWTLNIEATPIYAIQPLGPFADHVYQQMRAFLREQITEGVERVSIAGVVVGHTRLMSGQDVPIIQPSPRCMYSWSTSALVELVTGEATNESERDQTGEAVRSFLERAYHELRNLGVTPQERAINYAATNALNVERIFEAALREEMQLDTIDVERSPICRPDSECWEVKLTFFNPRRQLEQARRAYRFTVDVSDVCPVMVGDVRSWYVR